MYNLNNDKKVYLDLYGKGKTQELNRDIARCQRKRWFGFARLETVFCSVWPVMDERLDFVKKI